MANVKTLQRSFAGGEVSPEMFGRIDDVKYQSGASLLRNFLVKPTGPVENRPGFAFVREVKDSTKAVRLIPFTFNTTDTVVLEFGEEYIRFHHNGATIMDGDDPYEVETPYQADDLFDIHHVQSADVLTLVHPSYPPSELRRYGVTNWDLAEISFAPTVQAPLSVTATPTCETAKYDYYYVVTSIGVDGVSESSQSDVATCRGNVFETGGYNTIQWSASTGATRYYVYKQQGGVYGYIGNTTSLSMVDDNIAPDLSQTPPTYDIAFRTNGISSVPVTDGGEDYGTTYSGGNITTVTIQNGGSGYTDNTTYSLTDPTGSGAVLSITRDGSGIITEIGVTSGGSNYTAPTLTISDPGVGGETPVPGGTGFILGTVNVNPRTNAVVLTVTDDTGTGAVLSPVISDGEIIAINVVDPGQDYTDPTITITAAAGGSGAVFGAADLTGADYPGAVSYYEQRRAFAGTVRQPQNIWMTRAGTESNMSYSLPIRDDDRIAVRVAAREANTIRHIVPLSQLMLLTSAAEWRVTSVNSDAITPTSISVKPQSYIGASNVQPVIVNNNMIYCAARGGHIRECSYNWQANGFITGDLSIRATHLFDSHEILDLTYAKAPQPTLWFISDTGKLLGLTYVPEQQIGAWHQHDTTNGSFESCAVVAEDGEDVLYVVVRRTFGEESYRFVERMASRQFVDQADAYFVDCGATYDGEPADEISGLDWLEGQTVNILADGAVQSPRVVTDGAITLDVEASKVQIGLPIQSDIRTLPLALQVDGSYGQGRMKNINKAWLRVFRSSGIFIGPDENHLVEAKMRTTEPYGVAPALTSEEVQIMLTPAWASDGQVFVRQEDPLPLTVVALTLEVSVGG